jgi:hypothetical protein
MKFLAKERPLTPSWDLLGPSFELAKKYVWHIVYLSLLPNLLYAYASTLLGNNVYHDLVYGLSSRQHTGLILVGVAFAWSLIVYPGYIYFQTMAIRKKEVSISESIRAGLHRLLPLIGLGIMGGITTFIGLLLFIVPGLILIRAYFLASYYVIDQKLGPVEAFKKSYAETKPVSVWVWGTIGVTLVISLISAFAGILPLVGVIIGTIFTYIYAFGPALRYGEITDRQTILPKIK